MLDVRFLLMFQWSSTLFISLYQALKYRWEDSKRYFLPFKLSCVYCICASSKQSQHSLRDICVRSNVNVNAQMGVYAIYGKAFVDSAWCDAHGNVEFALKF